MKHTSWMLQSWLYGVVTIWTSSALASAFHVHTISLREYGPSIHQSPSFRIRTCITAQSDDNATGGKIPNDASDNNKQSAPDRTIVDTSTLTLLEHVNLNVPSQEHIIPFYLELLGFGLDPRKAINFDPNKRKSQTIWVNCGASQFHMPYGETAQRIPGSIGLRYDSLTSLKRRLNELSKTTNDIMGLQEFDILTDPRTQRDYVRMVDVYGNVFFCRESIDSSYDRDVVFTNGVQQKLRQPIIGPHDTDEWGDYATKYGLLESECRGIDYVEFNCPVGSADKIALFYESVFDATTTVVQQEVKDGNGRSVMIKIAIIAIGEIDDVGKANQSLLFRETTETSLLPPSHDGHHVALYVGTNRADFEQAFKNADIAGVVWVNPRFSDKATTLETARELKQFRFKDIVDMETGDVVMELEHEVRSVDHDAFPGN